MTFRMFETLNYTNCMEKKTNLSHQINESGTGLPESAALTQLVPSVTWFDELYMTLLTVETLKYMNCMEKKTDL